MKIKMNKTKEKESVIDLLKNIPEDATYEDIIAEIYFRNRLKKELSNWIMGNR
ncbi:MAG: hypothetical protein R2942_02750 [Ignavibacteria bacterium]